MKEDSTPASSSAESAVRIIDPGLIAGWAEQRLVQPSRANLPRVTEVFKDILSTANEYIASESGSICLIGLPCADEDLLYVAAYGSRADLSPLFLDLDCFKAVVDTHGHLVGSQVLAEVGRLIARVVPHPTATLARYGGRVCRDPTRNRRRGGCGYRGGDPTGHLRHGISLHAGGVRAPRPESQGRVLGQQRGRLLPRLPVCNRAGDGLEGASA